MPPLDEDEQLRLVALQNAQSILQARQRAEDELRKHSEWLRTTLGSIGDAVISTDAEGRVNFMNGVAEVLTGWTQGDALGYPLTDIFRIVNEEARQPVENPALRALREGVIVGLANHTLLISKDGTERPIDDSAAPVRSASGEIVGCVLVFRDVTDRRAADRALHRSERDLADSFENANVGLHWVGPEGTILRVNKAELDMLGYAREEYIGRHIAEFHADQEVIDDILARLARGEHLREIAARLRCKDGTIRHVLVNSSVLFEEGRFVHTRCFTLDITERIRAEVARAELAAIVETSDDAIVSKTLDGIIRSWNPGAERIFGYSAAEAVGKSINLIIPPELQHEERSILEQLRCGKRVGSIETVRIAKDGRRLNMSLTVSPVKNAHGEVVGASKVGRDITERKKAEAERETLLASERTARADAERASRAKEEFLATLSHELRTPLNAILGWVHILTKKPPTEDSLKQGLAVIDRNARMQAQLIGDLLDMSRIISGKMRLDVQRVELPVVIEAALDAVRPAAEAKNVRIQSMLEPITDPVHGDPTRLQQVVWNLVSNAVKFTPRGGRVQIVLARVNSHIELTVSDTGKGIRTEFLPHVFERFRQSDGSPAREHGGLGLGLAIVKQLVELHGGAVMAASDGEGTGSTFTVKLPLAAVRRSTTETSEVHPISPQPGVVIGESPGLSGVNVLVVDDEADARDLIQRVLEEAGASVALAGSAEEALRSVDQLSFHVILSDIGMPGRDGYSLMRAIRQNGIKAPAAALTAFARSEDRTRALHAGYQTHIAKPVDPTELIAAVAALASTLSAGGNERMAQ